LASLRLPFIENQGQLLDRVAFFAPTFFGTVLVTREGTVVYSLPPSRERRTSRRYRIRSGGSALTETFVSGKPLPRGGRRVATGVSSFHGSRAQLWRTGLPARDEVRLGEVWPHIFVSLRAHGGCVEKIFTLRP